MFKLYEKLELEFQKLNKKMSKLKKFIDSDDYQCLDDVEKCMLFTQYEAMRTYGSCLVNRMKYIQYKTTKKTRARR